PIIIQTISTAAGTELAPKALSRCPPFKIIPAPMPIIIIRGLVLPAAVTDKFTTPDVLKVVSTASVVSALKKGPSSKLNGLQQNLHRKIQKTLNEIKAEIHTQ
ncbi:unnamed protein product, partial [marine sediment metagenome]